MGNFGERQWGISVSAITVASPPELARVKLWVAASLVRTSPKV